MTASAARRGFRGRPARFLAVAALVAAAGPAVSLAAWDLSGTAGLQYAWASNTTFNARPGSGGEITLWRLGGQAQRTGRRSRFEAAYSPTALLYRDRGQLNTVTHQGRLGLALDLSSRSALIFSGNALYTNAEDPANVAPQPGSALVFTRLSDRRVRTIQSEFRSSLTAATRLVVDLRHQANGFANPSLVDVAGTSTGIRAEHELNPRFGVEGGGTYAWNRFHFQTLGSAASPGRIANNGVGVSTVFAGGHADMGDRTTGTIRIGYNVADPDDPARATRHGFQAQASLQRTGAKVNINAGYNRALTTGTGAFALTRSETWHAGLVVPMTQDLSARFNVSRSSGRTLHRTRGRETSNLNGDAGISWRLGRRLAATADFSRHVQNSQNPRAPDLAFNRLQIGLLATFG